MWKSYSEFIYILMFLSQFLSFFSLASLSLLLIFLTASFFFPSLVILCFLFTALWSFGPKCVTLACWLPLLPSPNRSLLRTVLTGYFLPTPSGPKPIMKENEPQRILLFHSSKLFVYFYFFLSFFIQSTIFLFFYSIFGGFWPSSSEQIKVHWCSYYQFVRY